MSFFQFVFQDWRVNKKNPKGRMFLILFRIANFCTTRRVYLYLGFPYLLFYKIAVQWLFSLDIPWKVKIGKNLSIFHCYGLVVNYYVVIGENCKLRHCTTIGSKDGDGSMGGAPIIGDNVDIGSNSCIIGAIRINNNVKVGTGSVVVKDIEPNCVVVGNPAVKIKSLDLIKT